MLQNKINAILILLGLNEFESSLYIYLIDHKQANITELCNKLGAYRQKVYDALAALQNLGLIEKHNDFSRRIIIKPPSILATLLKKKQYEINNAELVFEELLPELMGGFQKAEKYSQVRVFDGLNRFRYLFSTILDEAVIGENELLMFNEGDDMYETLDINYFLNVWVDKRIKKGIYAKILTNSENSIAQNEISKNKESFRESRFLRPNFNAKGCFWVLGDKVILWDTKQRRAIVLQGDSLASFYGNIFYSFWEGANKIS